MRLATLRAARLEPVRRIPIEPHRRALVLGGGVAGMTAALTVADAGFDVTLVERADALGGNLRHIYYLAEGLQPPAAAARPDQPGPRATTASTC